MVLSGFRTQVFSGITDISTIILIADNFDD